MFFKKPLLYLGLSLSLLTSCSHDHPLDFSTWQQVTGRDDGESLARPLLYRAKTFSHWIRKDPLATESIADTTKAICEFYIRENDQLIRVTVHTFPINNPSARIPPQAQIARWKKQFEELDPLAVHIWEDSHGGFSGLGFEGQGLLKGAQTKVMGCSMRLASCYQRLLSQSPLSVDRQKCADYTIKASGPPELMNKHRADILAFVQSFELIDELSFSL